MDVDNYGNLDVNKVIEFLEKQTVKKKNYTINKKTKKRIRVIIIVHVFGNVADVIKLKSICKKKKYFNYRRCFGKFRKLLQS